MRPRCVVLVPRARPLRRALLQVTLCLPPAVPHRTLPPHTATSQSTLPSHTLLSPLHSPLSRPPHAEPCPSPRRTHPEQRGLRPWHNFTFPPCFHPGVCRDLAAGTCPGLPSQAEPEPPSTLQLQAGAGAPQQRTGAPPDVRFMPRGCCRAQEQVGWGSDRGWRRGPWYSSPTPF